MTTQTVISNVPTTLTREQQLELYHFLRLTRLLEERLTNLYRQTKVVGGLFRSLGQEATAVGTAYALDRSKNDMLTPLIRDLGAVLVQGGTPRELFLQYMAKKDSPSRGRDLNIHYSDLKRGFIGPISHLGDLMPVMTGVILASRMRKEDRVGLVYMGDGASSTGAFHEGLNFAAVQKLPIVVVIENNQYAYSTPTVKQMAVENIVDKAVGYGVHGVMVDGNDVIACYEVTKQAVDRARSGGGVTLIEAKTFRMKGHAEHDDQKYVPKELLEYWAERDPIKRYEAYLLENGLATQADLDAIVAKINASLDEDMAFAEANPMPDPESAVAGVYAEF